MRFLLYVLTSSSVLMAVNGRDPDLKITPGVCDSAVTVQALCSQKTEKKHVSDSLRKTTIASYKVDAVHQSEYVVDHLCPLELGGKTVPNNLWAQLKRYNHQKVVVENRLRRLVCEGHLPLAKAQGIITKGWWKYYDHEILVKPAPAKKKG